MTELDLANLIEQLPGRVFVKDTNSVYLASNVQFAAQAGMSPGELQGKRDADLPWAEFADGYVTDDRLVIDSGEPVVGIVETAEDQDGSTYQVLTEKAPLLVDGKVVGLIGISLRLPEQKH